MTQPNVACQILSLIGVTEIGTTSASLPRNKSYRKTGPGRHFAIGDGTRTSKQKSAGAFGRGLMNWIARNQAAALANK